MTHDLEQGEGAASVHRPTKRQKTSSAAAPPPPTMCCICRELLKPQDVAVSCTHCRFGIFCQDCLRDWFLKATFDETRMPVECCGDEIPVKKAKGFLTSEEIRLYEAKYDEWSTFDKLYCPIPQCSAFIPSKLYLVHSGDKFEPVTSATVKKKSVSCPKCRANICTTCRGPIHPMNGKECTSQRVDFDPKLEAKLKKWGVKRCPKCNAGVRLMYGCPHVRCRCSYSFCFGCLRAIEECEGRCGDGYGPEDELSEEDEEEITQEGADIELESQPHRHVSPPGGHGDEALPAGTFTGVRVAAEGKKPEDKADKKDDSDIDLDEGIGSELDLGSDPDEPQEWQCRHTSWTKTTVDGPGWRDPATVCNWCKSSHSERERLKEEALSKLPKEPLRFRNTISDITNPTPQPHFDMMICVQCGVRMCENCAKALGVK